MINIDKYFKNKVIEFEEIKGHFNTNFKVKTNYGLFHLKIFHDETYTVDPWIEGDVIKVWDEKTIKAVCSELKVLHDSDEVFEQMNFNVHNVKDINYTKLVNKYKNSPMIPCHNDLNQDNIVMGISKANLIDFEFARMNNLHWDIANIINEDNLNDQQLELFLKYYPKLNREALNDFIYINKKFIEWWNQYQLDKKNDPDD